jgi:hypothetical protein
MLVEPPGSTVETTAPRRPILWLQPSTGEMQNLLPTIPISRSADVRHTLTQTRRWLLPPTDDDKIAYAGHRTFQYASTTLLREVKAYATHVCYASCSGDQTGHSWCCRNHSSGHRVVHLVIISCRAVFCPARADYTQILK